MISKNISTTFWGVEEVGMFVNNLRDIRQCKVTSNNKRSGFSPCRRFVFNCVSTRNVWGTLCLCCEKGFVVTTIVKVVNREFTQRRRRRQRERQKINRFRQAKQQLCTCITPFCTFLCRRCTTTTWDCLISRFVEGGNKRQQLSFSFPELWCSPLEFDSKQICQHLTN